MTYSDKELQRIEELAAIFTPISIIADSLDIVAEVLRQDIKDRNTEVSKAYRRGKNGTLIKIRAQETQLAFVGSPLAIENANRNLMDMEDDE